ncbi:bifunctional bis(5'-adenosyl)-triphosphatase/adenylylsulfatase FHIT-like [Canna indica]|uniref:Bis(5'-adenosyl)-triphosphatase n=1 Tax=Canna indica TaxID=4628 RepID=A0AAQ3QG29_9LILI|nr:bifunctional bis(5'-adenosyl)-triphosphatase/adenylylsulfatase FHIT-like [Canna indica]
MKSALFSLLGLGGVSCSCTLLRRSGSQWSGVAPAAVLFGSSPQVLSPAASIPAPRSRIRPFGTSSEPQPVSRSQSQMAEAEHYIFGPYKIRLTEVFHSTALSYAMVNLRPVVPGHILSMKALIHFLEIIAVNDIHIRHLLLIMKDNIFCLREVKRFIDLTSDEVADLWATAKEVGGRLEQYHKASSLTFTIQDGPQAGQTVPHVHIHILPRKIGDFENNDEIYDAIDLKEKEMKEKLDLDKERKDRTSEEMAKEADEYRTFFS